MHDELATVAWRRGLREVILAALIVGVGFGLGIALSAVTRFHSAPALTPGHTVSTASFTVRPTGETWLDALAIFALTSAVAFVALVHKGSGRGARPSEMRLPPEPREANVMSEIALASGAELTAMYQIDSPGLNVGVIPTTDGFDVAFSSGANGGLERAELEAVCAAQLAGLQDRRARLLITAADRLRAGCLVTALAVVPAIILAFMRIDLVFAVAGIELGLAAACWLFAGRVRFWARARIDATVVATTHDPQALVSALPKVAAWNGDRVTARPFWGAMGAVDRYWLVPVSRRWVRMRTKDGSIRSSRSSEMDEDVALLVRASLVRRVCVSRGQADLTSYREIRDTLRMAGRAAAAGITVPVDGMQVGLEGALGPGADDHSLLLKAKADYQVGVRQGAAPTPGPGPGWYPDPGRDASGASVPGWRWWNGREWTSYRSTPARPVA